MYQSSGMMSERNWSANTALKDNKLFTFSVFWLLLVAQNPDLNSNRIIWWGSVILFLGVYLVTFQMRIRLDSYAVWIGSFVVICTASALWAITPSLVFGTMKSMMVQVVVLIILYASIRSQKDVEFVLQLVLLTCVLNAIYLLIVNQDILTDRTDEITEQLGGQNGWNANDVGLMASMSSILALYFFKNAVTLKNKTLFLVLIAFLAFVSLLSGSRKAVVILMGGMAAYIFLSSKGKRIRAIVFVVVLLSLLWYLIVEIPYFYSVVGWRMEAFLSQFTGEGELDHSAENRQILITAAVDAWKLKPILGHGLDCFRYFGKLATGRSYYAHNNFVELLADVGIVGFISYYSGYYHVLVHSWKNRKNNLSLLFFVSVCAMLISEYACVSYADFLYSVLIMLMFANSKCNN